MADEADNKTTDETTDETADNPYDIKPPEMDAPDAAEDAVEDAPVEVDTPTPTEEEVTPQADATEKAPEPVPPAHAGDVQQFDQALVDQGRAAGLTDEGMKRLGPAGTRTEVLSVENRRLRSQATPDPVENPPLDLSGMDLDEPTAEILKGLDARNRELEQKFDDMSQGIKQDQAVANRKEGERIVSRFDARLGKVGRGDVYGSGATSQMDQMSDQYRARGRLIATQQHFENQGESEENAFAMAVRSRHAEDSKKEAVEEIAATLEKSGKQAISKPSSGGPGPQPSALERGMAAENDWRKEQGLPPIEDLEPRRF